MHRTPYPGGAPANVAAALAKLSVKVAFISALGQDNLAVQMLDLLSGVTDHICNQLNKSCCQTMLGIVLPLPAAGNELMCMLMQSEVWTSVQCRG